MTPTRKRRLSACLTEISHLTQDSLDDIEITGIAWDSRNVRPGHAFFALVGENFDGHTFAQAAAARGAVAVIGSHPLADLTVPYVQIQEDDRVALAKFSAAFYDDPSRKLVVIGVTGTDGKTTTANLVYHILRTAGLATGMITSVNALIDDRALDTGFHVTTPEAPDIQRYLAQMADAGLTHMILEATSHGMAQRRAAAVDFDLAAVTNVTHEHLDYHRTYQGYLGAKGLLFEALGDASAGKGIEKLAVLNKDDESYPYLAGLSKTRQFSYSSNGDHTADVWAENIVSTPRELRFRVVGLNEEFDIHTPLIGHYNVANGLAAIGLTVVGLGIPISVVQAAFASAPGVAGRMERIDLGQDFLAIVDFAHTPNAIHEALSTARELTDGKVIAVFGSAGLRDIEKRKLMPEIAVGLADEVILTAEDPRTESLDDILADMAEGAVRGGGVEGQTFWREPDRGAALRLAVRRAKPGDLVITCGKGHEQSMCFGDVEYDWDDRDALRAALADLLRLSGYEMPYLPTSDNH